MIRDVWFEVAMKLVAVILVAVPGMPSSRVFPVFHAVGTSLKAGCFRPGPLWPGISMGSPNPKTSLWSSLALQCFARIPCPYEEVVEEGSHIATTGTRIRVSILPVHESAVAEVASTESGLKLTLCFTLVTAIAVGTLQPYRQRQAGIQGWIRKQSLGYYKP